MTERYSDSTTPPQMLTPAPVYVPVAPPSSGGGVLRALLVTAALLLLFGGALVVALLWMGGSIMTSTDSWIEENYHSGNKSATHKIAIVSVEDVIMDLTARHVLRQLKAAHEDDDVKAVVLKVDSPGGTINASDQIHRKVKELCRGSDRRKPVVVSMQGLAASGGYYVSAPADQIFAERTTMTGSIGVIASFPNFHGLMDQYKVRMEVVKTGPMKDAGSPFRAMTEDEKQRWQVIINDSFQTFLEVVSEGRNMDLEKVRALATGDVYTAREAKANGLVDEIGYLEDAIAAAEARAGVRDSKVIEYKRPLDIYEILFGAAAAGNFKTQQFDLQSLFRANVPRVMFLTQVPSIE
jgi:protease-4